MRKWIALMTVWSFFIIAILLSVHTASFAGCSEDCKKECCGDEGICNGESELSCVSSCLKKDCNEKDESGTSAKCSEDCKKECCGDEGICNGESELSCVSSCLKKDCD